MRLLSMMENLQNKSQETDGKALQACIENILNWFDGLGIQKISLTLRGFIVNLSVMDSVDCFSNNGRRLEDLVRASNKKTVQPKNELSIEENAHQNEIKALKWLFVERMWKRSIELRDKESRELKKNSKK